MLYSSHCKLLFVINTKQSEATFVQRFKPETIPTFTRSAHDRLTKILIALVYLKHILFFFLVKYLVQVLFSISRLISHFQRELLAVFFIFVGFLLPSWFYQDWMWCHKFDFGDPTKNRFFWKFNVSMVKRHNWPNILFLMFAWNEGRLLVVHILVCILTIVIIQKRYDYLIFYDLKAN